ncbi:MAG: motility associated factor glycosyltransferase family protein, partial [Chlamydiales bacterium]|nr:motility associated factor glycosyltransferase family protein [Chlamydiales bacterium]
MLELSAEAIGMGIDCVGSRGMTLLKERYPEFSLLLWEEVDSPYPPCPLEKSSPFLKKLPLESVDLLYIFGIGSGSSYIWLKGWLEQKKERALIFLEDDLAAISSFSQTEYAEDLLQNSQVHLRFIPAKNHWDEIIEELVKTYPSQKVEVAAIPVYAQKRRAFFQKIRLKLMRKSAVCHALMTEALYSHRLTQNILRNIRLWPDSFFANHFQNRFQGIPAIICGAGPSLGPTIPLLQELENRALLIGGGSAIAALTNQGITPHLAIALDPNPEEYERLRAASAYEVPLIYGTRVQPDIFSTCNGPKGYIHSHTGGPCEAYFEKELGIQADPVGPDLGEEALSVTTLAIAFAVQMGCSPILLNGVDLAYTGMKRYAEGIMSTSCVALKDLQKEVRSSERLVKKKGIGGASVHTLVKWVMESSCISSYAKEHPATRFINVSQSGLGFEGIPNISISE